jgi:hypothetical protein
VEDKNENPQNIREKRKQCKKKQMFNKSQLDKNKWNYFYQ